MCASVGGPKTNIDFFFISSEICAYAVQIPPDIHVHPDRIYSGSYGQFVVRSSSDNFSIGLKPASHISWCYIMNHANNIESVKEQDESKKTSKNPHPKTAHLANRQN